MSILSITAAVAVIFLLAYRFYGRFLAKRVFCLDDARPTPAVTLRDGVDYEPTAASYLLGQHFSAIAAAGDHQPNPRLSDVRLAACFGLGSVGRSLCRRCA